jgi:diguanylate cyclase (GGDEF)-like protein
MAKVLQTSVERAGDFVARWGGEEFTVLLPNTCLKSVAAIAERMRLAIKETMVLLPDGTPTSTTISIGINSEIPTVDSTVNNFIVKADNALYADKREGKDRVCGSR